MLHAYADADDSARSMVGAAPGHLGLPLSESPVAYHGPARWRSWLAQQKLDLGHGSMEPVHSLLATHRFGQGGSRPGAHGNICPLLHPLAADLSQRLVDVGERQIQVLG